MSQMIWGFALFALSKNRVNYNNVSTSKNYRHAFNDRVGNRAAQQYLGQGEDTITITGTLVPFVTGGRIALQQFQAQAESGLPYPLIESNGTAHGFYVITSLTTEEHDHIADGRPKVIEYTLSFKRVGDDSLDYSKIAVGMGSLLA